MVLATTAPRRVQHDRSLAAHKNVGDMERWLSVLGGSALAVYGFGRRDLRGGLLTLLGAELVRRGATGHCLMYDRLGLTTKEDALAAGVHRVQPASRSAVLRASDAVKIERSITVDRPADELYAFWRDPSNLPLFMELIADVLPISDTAAHWRVRSPTGRTLEWESRVINDVPNELIAWKSSPHSAIANAGSVHFRPAPNGRGTLVTLVAEYAPPGGRLGNSLVKLFGRDPDTMVRDDLRRFKELMEQG